DLLLLDEVDRVANARRRLVAVVERDYRHHPAVDATPRVDLGVASLRAPIELAPEAGRGALERRRHADPDVAGRDAGRAARPVRQPRIGGPGARIHRLRPRRLARDQRARYAPPDRLQRAAPLHLNSPDAGAPP